MGPITIFDKSFLESLNVDEAVWFDQFYVTIITPLFFVETLADLEKEIASGRSQEQVVGSIAYRTPVLHSSPSASHVSILISNLLGHHIPMEGRIIRPEGRMVSVDGQVGVVYEEAPETQAMQRWQDGKFSELERDFAKNWREGLRTLDLNKDSQIFRKIWSGSTRVKNLQGAKKIAEGVVSGSGYEYELLRVVLELFSVPKSYWQRIGNRWHLMGKPPLQTFAPYAAHLLLVDFFFYLSISGGIISGERSSNRIDIAYLYYLPFCDVFVSNDRLHQRTAALFLRGKQKFIWGQDLKADFSKLDTYFSGFPREVQNLGLMRFASRPPLDSDYLTTALWDQFLNPKWREGNDEDLMKPPPQLPKLLEYTKKMTSAAKSGQIENTVNNNKLNAITIKRNVPIQRGKWRIVPNDIGDN